MKRLAEEEAERRAIEEAERMEVVRQIRALESVPVDRTAHFDATTVRYTSVETVGCTVGYTGGTTCWWTARLWGRGGT